MYATAISSGDFNGYTGHVPARNESKKRWNLSQKRYWLTVHTDKNCNGDVTRKVKKKNKTWVSLKSENFYARIVERPKFSFFSFHYSQ